MMPYEVGRDNRCPGSKPYAVRKVNGKKLLGCHVSRASAQRQMAAIGMHEAGKEKQMPYPNEHACRIKDPGGFQKGSFRRISRGAHAGKGPRDGKKVSIIIGKLKGKTTTTTQAFRYPTGTWTEAQARQHCGEQGGSFEAASGKKEVDPMTEFFLSDDVIIEDDAEQKETKMYGEVVDSDYVPWGVTSFAELQAAREADEATHEMKNLAGDLQGLLRNRILEIMADEETGDKAAVIVDSLKELARELTEMVVAEADVTMKEGQEGGMVDDEIERAWKTAPRFPAEISIDKGSWFEDLVNRVKEALNLSKKPTTESAPPSKELMLWKDKDGIYRWIATYSNNYRDDDNPPEIIAAKSHKRFVEMVDKGDAKPPELWLWHVPEWKWGHATWVAYDDAGFALAGGTVDKGCEWLAEAINDVPHDKVLVSHGMPRHTIKREEKDNSIIIEHLTREVSPLLALAAANKITGFEILHKEGQTMTIPTEKRTALIEEWGLDPSKLDELEAANAQHAEGAKEAGIEAKEKDQTPAKEASPEPEDAETPTIDAQITEAFQVLAERLDRIESTIGGLSGDVKALKEADAAKVAKAVEETPAASLADLIRGGRAVGSEEAKIDGRKSLAKQGPQEAETKDNVPQVSVVPFLNQLVAPRQ